MLYLNPSTTSTYPPHPLYTLSAHFHLSLFNSLFLTLSTLLFFPLFPLPFTRSLLPSVRFPLSPHPHTSPFLVLTLVHPPLLLNAPFFPLSPAAPNLPLTLLPFSLPLSLLVGYNFIVLVAICFLLMELRSPVWSPWPVANRTLCGSHNSRGPEEMCRAEESAAKSTPAKPGRAKYAHMEPPNN